MKNECAGTSIAEYIGPHPKFYLVLRTDEEIIKKAKEVKSMLTKNRPTLKNYNDELFDKETYTHKMIMLRIWQHNIY